MSAKGFKTKGFHTKGFYLSGGAAPVVTTLLQMLNYLRFRG